MSKNLSTVLILLVIVAGGYLLFKYGLPEKKGGGEKEISEEGAKVLNQLEADTGIKFSAVSGSNFKWVKEEIKMANEDGTMELLGAKYEADGVAREKKDEIAAFFEEKGYTLDSRNSADGEIGGVAGYRRDQAICLVGYVVTGFNPDVGTVPEDASKLDLEIKCGVSED